MKTEQTNTESNLIIQGFKFNYSNKERALKDLETEQIFKELNINVYKE